MDPESNEWRPRHNPWLITLAVMAATFMGVLDISMVNVALPYIAGNLSVTPEESTGVLTGYLVANGIVLLLTGRLTTLLGRKRLLVLCIGIFTFASALCGLATTLGMLELARVLQGVGGGALLPISLALLLEAFSPRRRGLAIFLWAMGVLLPMILGPTLGGWITDNYSWRWIFYINLPVGLVAAIMCQVFVEDPPSQRVGRSMRMGYVGFVWLLTWLGTLQAILDKGQKTMAVVAATFAVLVFLLSSGRRTGRPTLPHGP